MPVNILQSFVLPIAVVVSAAGTTSSAVFAWKMYQSHRQHERALFGEEEVDGHDGIISTVNENTAMTDEHRRTLLKHDLINKDGDTVYPRHQSDDARQGEI
jgi:hypothetical protein